MDYLILVRFHVNEIQCGLTFSFKLVSLVKYGARTHRRAPGAFIFLLYCITYTYANCMHNTLDTA